MQESFSKGVMSQKKWVTWLPQKVERGTRTLKRRLLRLMTTHEVSVMQRQRRWLMLAEHLKVSQIAT